MAPEDKTKSAESEAGGKSGTSLLDHRYQILNPLGSGAMGFVFQAFDTRLNRTVAIKVLSAELELDEEMNKRFAAEAKVASTFSHPNVAAIYDCGLDSEGTPYIVMEFVDGSALDSILKNGNRLRPDDAIKIFKQVAEGLHHAHLKGVVHRDLKPGNVIITKDAAGHKVAKLVDFGLAKVVLGERTTRLTRTGDVLGTPLYMSPEQITGPDVDARTDIYSLGCLMFHALTGSVPFRGKDALATAHMHVTAPMPEIPLDYTPENHRLIAIVKRCMEKKSGDRFASALEVADALASVHERLPLTSSSSVRPSMTQVTKAPSPVVIGLVILVVTIVLAVGIAVLMHLH